MARLTIAPLGTKYGMTAAAREAVTSAERLCLQTENHLSCSWVIDSRSSYETMDDIYSDAYDFDELNERIAKRLITGQNTVYAPLGRGISGQLLAALKALAAENGTEIVILPSTGFAEAAAAAAQFDISGGAVHYANSVPETVNVQHPQAFEEIDTRLRAGELKLALAEFYPDNAEMTFCRMTPSGDYDCKPIPLYELDRQDSYGADTVLLAPPFDYLQLERFGLDGLEWVTKRLRAPDGCPWDAKQTHETLKTPLIEEAYEVMDTIIEKDTDAMCEELGDLLLQIVFHAQIEEEHSSFTMRDVCTGIVQKLIYRHPHVFAKTMKLDTADEVLTAWEQLKKKEKHQETQTDAMLSVPKSFPALMRSFKVQKKAADVGFDWDNPYDALEKVDEEKREVIDADRSGDKKQLEQEIGDLLFSVVNVSRLFKVDPEIALGAAADKFVYRFSLMEKMIHDDGLDFSQLSLQDLDKYWEKAKKC